ncbi:hypothetical protein ACN28S_04065 [Cystobacter fuscus]
MSNTEKLRRAVWYAMTSPELPADVRSALQEMFNPTNLGIVAGVLAVWAGAHFFGLGEVADIVVAGVVYASLGEQAIQGLIEIAEFAREVIAATTDLQLRRASTRLTRAIAILGVDTAMAVLLRGARVVSRPVRRRTTPNALGEAPKPSSRGGAISDVAPAVPRPQLRQGARTIWGDIKATDSALPEHPFRSPSSWQRPKEVSGFIPTRRSTWVNTLLEMVYPMAHR